MFFVYILFSEKISRFYVGQTKHLQNRMDEHNHGISKSTKNGIPWKLIRHFVVNTRSEAVQLERKIKKRGIKRFIDQLN